MSGFQNLHTHTTYCDGALSPEDMVGAAIGLGLSSLGISEHSYVPFDIYYSMDMIEASKYIAEVSALKSRYEDKIEIFLGLERDYYTEEIPDGLDYVIGALHYACVNGEYLSVDAGPDRQKEMVDLHFGGDFYALAENYFSVLSNIAVKTKPDIIGHFDLVSKYNLEGSLFDETNPVYISAALCAMDEILKTCNLFEANTGAMYRLGKKEPYPSTFFLKELLKRGGEVIMSSDSHDAASIGYKFSDMLELLRFIGFRHIKRLTKGGFVNIDI